MAYNLKNNVWQQDIKISLDAADADSIVASATYPAGYIPLNGALADLTVAQLPTVEEVTLTSGANLSAINFTIVGVDFDGNVVTETLAGPNANTVTTTAQYWRVTSVTPDATSASTVQIGIAGDDDAIAAAAAPTADTPMDIVSAALASATEILIANPAFESFNAGGDESLNTYTVNGVDLNGAETEQEINGPNATTDNLELPFRRIYWISQANAGAGTLEVGNAAATYSPWCYHSKQTDGFKVEMVGIVPGGTTVNYKVQHLAKSKYFDVEAIFDDAYITGSTESDNTFLSNEPFDASRVFINSGTGPLTIYFLVRPAGLMTAGIVKQEG